LSIQASNFFIENFTISSDRLCSGRRIHLPLFGGTRDVLLLLIVQVVIVNVLEALVVVPKETPGMTATAVMTVTGTANVTAMSTERGTGGGGAGALIEGEALPLIGRDTIARVLLRWKIPRKMMIVIYSHTPRRRTTTRHKKLEFGYKGRHESFVFSMCKKFFENRLFYS